MKNISYTINQGKIAISQVADDVESLVKVYNEALAGGLSFLFMTGPIPCELNSVFNPSLEKGIILSVQLLDRNTSLEFESKQCWKMNFSPNVMSVQLMLTSLHFRHRYENPAIIHRIDIFIPAKKASALLKPRLLKQLESKEILNLSEEENDLSRAKTNNFLQNIIKEFEKPPGEYLGTQMESFLQSLKAN